MTEGFWLAVYKHPVTGREQKIPFADREGAKAFAARVGGSFRPALEEDGIEFMPALPPRRGEKFSGGRRGGGSA